jgi:hypothetical protein
MQPFPWRPPELENKFTLHPRFWFVPLIEQCSPPGRQGGVPFPGYYFGLGTGITAAANVAIQQLAIIHSTTFGCGGDLVALSEYSRQLDRSYKFRRRGIVGRRKTAGLPRSSHFRIRCCAAIEANAQMEYERNRKDKMNE